MVLVLRVGTGLGTNIESRGLTLLLVYFFANKCFFNTDPAYESHVLWNMLHIFIIAPFDNWPFLSFQDLLSEKQSHRAAEREWMSQKDRLLRLLDEAHDRGYESEEDAAAAAAEELQQQQQSMHVIDAGAGGDGPGIGGASGVGVSASTSGPEVKQMADHGAQTLIPSLGKMLYYIRSQCF